MEQQAIEWVRQHQCLGVWLSARLTFYNHVEYLRERTSARLAIMRHITSLSGGANDYVLRAFYLHGIKPIIEYSVPTLANVTEHRFTAQKWCKTIH